MERPPRDRKAATSWACVVATNLAMDVHRRAGREDSKPEVAEVALPDFAEPTGLKDAMRAGLAALAPDLRATIVLRFYADFTVPEIAAAMAIPEGNCQVATAPCDRGTSQVPTAGGADMSDRIEEQIRGLQAGSTTSSFRLHLARGPGVRRGLLVVAFAVVAVAASAVALGTSARLQLRRRLRRPAHGTLTVPARPVQLPLGSADVRARKGSPHSNGFMAQAASADVPRPAILLEPGGPYDVPFVSDVSVVTDQRLDRRFGVGFLRGGGVALGWS